MREPVCGHPCSAGCSGTAGAKCTAERAHCVRAPCAGNRRVRAPWSAERSATAREGPRKYVEALPQRTRMKQRESLPERAAASNETE